MNKRREEADEAAAIWDARLRGAKASARDRMAFQTWLHEDSEHQAAHDRLQAALSMLRAIAGVFANGHPERFIARGLVDAVRRELTGSRGPRI